MKKMFITALLLATLLLSPANADETTYKVIKVIDGDTVFVDFNKNGIAEQKEKVRINGIDTFETRVLNGLAWQMETYNLTLEEALGLGYLGKEFARKELLNKEVIAKYTADRKTEGP